MHTFADVDARPGYNSCKAHEFVDEPDVLRQKVQVLAKLIRESRQAIAYTGAGISTASGIADYATRSGETISSRPKLMSPFDAEATLAHRVLTALHAAGHLKYWIQQNHDGLPQKAGYPQHALNEVHGAWYDPSNPVVKMGGQLRNDLFEDLLAWEQRTDLCLAIGTSMAGMNADRVATTVARKAAKYDRVAGSMRPSAAALGMVIVGLQQTAHDSASALRIFAEIDTVMGMLQEEMRLVLREAPSWKRTEDVFAIPYGADGTKTEEYRTLDLREGQRIRITTGQYKGDEGEVVGKQRQGHYKIRVWHTVKGTWKVPQEHVLGRWFPDEALRGLLPSFPIESIIVSALDADTTETEAAKLAQEAQQ
jgi:NAD-dependent SIR2 family protein deacetylase